MQSNMPDAWQRKETLGEPPYFPVFGHEPNNPDMVVKLKKHVGLRADG